MISFNQRSAAQPNSNTQLCPFLLPGTRKKRLTCKHPSKSGNKSQYIVVVSLSFSLFYSVLFRLLLLLSCQQSLRSLVQLAASCFVVSVFSLVQDIKRERNEKQVCFESCAKLLAKYPPEFLVLRWTRPTCFILQKLC